MSLSRLPLIIVVDDSETVLTTARAVLEAAGCRVITHNRAAGCVALILQEKPDLVLIDVNMPEVNGDTIAKLFGKARPDSNTIVLLYSGMPEPALRAKTAACGAHGYVRKTHDSYEFMRQVNGFLRRSSGTHAALSSAKVRAAQAIEPSVHEEPARANPPSTTPPSATPASVTPPSGGPAASPASGARSKPLRDAIVLFIDDDMGILSAFRRDVQSEPYLVEFALSGQQALKRILSDSPPDLVVSDVLMPGLGGAEVYRRAVAASRGWQHRFLFVTGAGFADEVSRLVGDYNGLVLTKPVEGQRLRRAIREQLNWLSDPRRTEAATR